MATELYLDSDQNTCVSLIGVPLAIGTSRSIVGVVRNHECMRSPAPRVVHVIGGGRFSRDKERLSYGPGYAFVGNSGVRYAFVPNLPSTIIVYYLLATGRPSATNRPGMQTQFENA